MRRILGIPDLHIRHKDIKSCVGYRDAVRHVVKDLIEIVVENNIDTIFFFGDIFDSGYGEYEGEYISDIKLLTRLIEKVNGNAYEVIGNHINIQWSRHPEHYFISPNTKYKIRGTNFNDEQIIKTPDHVIIDGVNFYFMHWDINEKNKNFDPMVYKPKLENNGGKQVGLFHSDYVALHRIYEQAKSDDSQISRIVEGLDIALTGHIHQPMEPFLLGKTLMINPGSLCNCTATKIHSTVSLPILVCDNGNVNLEFIDDVSLHTEEVNYLEDDGQENIEIKTFVSNKNRSEIQVDEKTFLMDTMTWLSETSDMPETDKKICNILFADPTDLTGLVNEHANIMSGTQNNLSNEI